MLREDMSSDEVMKCELVEAEVTVCTAGEVGEVAEVAGEVAGEGAGRSAAGRAVESAQADDRRLIALVRARRLLYARSTLPVASYYSQVKSLWEEVANSMGWTVPEVRRKWSHIRNSYSRHLRNQVSGARTGRGRAVSSWYLADEMAFLRDHMATDTRPSPYKSHAPTMVALESALDVPAGEEVVSTFMAPWYLNQTTLAKEVKVEQEDNSQSFEVGEDSSFFQFFRGIYNDYQELPAKKQRLFKRQCLLLLHNLLDEEDASYQHGAINLSSSGSGHGSDDDHSVLPE